MNADNSQDQYRLPPLNTAFVKAHGLLFTNREIKKFKSTINEFLRLLDNQIGRVTRKFIEQEYHIAIANSVSILGFVLKDNVLIKAISSKDNNDTQMKETTSNDISFSMTIFKNACFITNGTLEIVLQRIGNPNVLPFIHVTLVFMFRIFQHPGAMSLLEADFPWKLLFIMLNTLLAIYEKSSRIENDSFPLLKKENVRPFPKDFAMQGLL